MISTETSVSPVVLPNTACKHNSKKVSFGSTTIIPLLPVEENEHDIIQDEHEEVGVRTIPDTCLPCQSEIDKHNVNHIPYISWCPSCVKVRLMKPSVCPLKLR